MGAALIRPASFRLLMQTINWARRTCEADDAWENCSTDAAQVSTPPPERGVMALEASHCRVVPSTCLVGSHTMEAKQTAFAARANWILILDQAEAGKLHPSVWPQ